MLYNIAYLVLSIRSTLTYPSTTTICLISLSIEDDDDLHDPVLILLMIWLGMSAELKQRMTRDALAKKVSNMAESEPIYTLSTPVTAAQADHSFNGIIFDVMCKSPYEVEITSISVAGMLGRVVCRDILSSMQIMIHFAL